MEKYGVLFYSQTFTRLNKERLLVDSWSRGLDQNQMYPDRDTLSNVPRSGYITARDQSMVESGVTEGGKNTANFLFRE